MPLDFRRIFPRPWRLASAGPGAGRGASVELSPPAPGRWHALCADQAFWGVVAVWLLCWLGWAILLDRYSCPLPFADDYQACVHGLMTGEQPLTLEALWRPSNEHRMPLTRLWFILLGRGLSWDFRAMR